MIDKKWNEIAIGTEKYWEKWNLGCEKFSKNMPKDLKIIVLEIYLPRFYKDKSGKIKKYSQKRLEIINKYNSIMKECYSRFIEKISCQVISNFGNTIICQTPEVDGTNYRFFREVADKISKKLMLNQKLRILFNQKLRPRWLTIQTYSV